MRQFQFPNSQYPHLQSALENSFENTWHIICHCTFVPKTKRTRTNKEKAITWNNYSKSRKKREESSITSKDVYPIHNEQSYITTMSGPIHQNGNHVAEQSLAYVHVQHQMLQFLFCFFFSFLFSRRGTTTSTQRSNSLMQDKNNKRR